MLLGLCERELDWVTLRVIEVLPVLVSEPVPVLLGLCVSDLDPVELGVRETLAVVVRDGVSDCERVDEALGDSDAVAERVSLEVEERVELPVVVTESVCVSEAVGDCDSVCVDDCEAVVELLGDADADNVCVPVGEQVVFRAFTRMEP